MRNLVVYILAFFCACCSVVAQNAETATEMHIVVLGSSSVWLGGDGGDDPAGWTYWCRQVVQPTSLRSYARSGATWSCTPQTQYTLTDSTALLSDNNVIFNQIGRLQKAYETGKQTAPDVIIIGAGTNDVWFAKRRPNAMGLSPQEAMQQSIDTHWQGDMKPVGALGDSLRDVLIDSVPQQLTSVALAIRYSVLWLQNLFPDAKIVLLTPTQISKVSETQTEQISVLIAEMAAMMQVGCIRLDRLSPIRRADELQGYHYTTDGVHTTQEAAQIHGECIAKQLALLLSW